MLFLDQVSKEFLSECVERDLKVNLLEFFKHLRNILKEDTENVDLSGFQNRCNWILSKIVDDKTVLLKYAETDNFKEMFKNIVVGESEGKITLAINNIEVTGNTKFLAVVILMFSFGLYTNLKTLGDNFDKIGGALVEKFSETLTLEFGKRADLSMYSLNGDVFRSIGSMIHNSSPVVNIFMSVLGMLLIRKDFDKATQANLLLLAKAVKTQASNSVGYLYSFLSKSGDLLNIDFEFLAKDIYYQFKAVSGV